MIEMGILDDLKAKNKASDSVTSIPASTTNQEQTPSPAPPPSSGESKAAIKEASDVKNSRVAEAPSEVPVAIPGSRPGEVRNTLSKTKLGRPPYRDEKGVWKAEFPYSMSNGDLVLDETLPTPSELDPNANMAKPVATQILARHRIKLVKKSDPSQSYPYLMDCSCGSQARVYTEAAVRQAADNHLRNRVKAESPR